MKKCPNCQKEFPDTMRFCQTDGTPLLDAVEESQAEDPLKTTVVRQEDISSSIPPSDPFKTMVAKPGAADESGDLLQLPEEEFDPLKTMVAQPIGQDKSVLDEPKFEDIKEDIKPASSSFGGFSQPSDPLPQAPSDYSNDPTLAQPQPPKFNEPSLSPPDFGDLSSKKNAEDDLPQTVMQNPWDSGNAPKSDQSPYSNDSPFSKPSETPMSSPFDAPKSSTEETRPPFDEPKSPFGQPSSPFDAPKSPFDAQQESPFNQPQSSFNESQSPFDAPPSNYQEPSNQFGSAASQFEQMNQGFSGNQPLQQNDWMPPPSPEASWQNQGIGANTPFQPPVVSGGQNQTMAIISLVLGILSIFCCGWILPGIGAVVLGFMAKSKAEQNPAEYGGRGLALGGIITGGISLLLGVIVIILYLLGALASIGR
ncbi:MAG TPA: DUF4190 domain-containing protein [Pyrinomonadaceae bacterium]